MRYKYLDLGKWGKYTITYGMLKGFPGIRRFAQFHGPNITIQKGESVRWLRWFVTVEMQGEFYYDKWDKETGRALMAADWEICHYDMLYLHTRANALQVLQKQAYEAYTTRTDGVERARTLVMANTENWLENDASAKRAMYAERLRIAQMQIRDNAIASVILYDAGIPRRSNILVMQEDSIENNRPMDVSNNKYKLHKRHKGESELRTTLVRPEYKYIEVKTRTWPALGPNEIWLDPGCIEGGRYTVFGQEYRAWPHPSGRYIGVPAATEAQVNELAAIIETDNMTWNPFIDMEEEQEATGPLDEGPD